ncbi:MAG: hypothetical protein K2K19_04500 [Acetatifactor sp.]|nr:hypothetical protein [Acetatifactor sp.]
MKTKLFQLPDLSNIADTACDMQGIGAVPHTETRSVDSMMNFHNKKTKKVVSAIIVIVIVLAMVIPTLAYLI